MTDCSVVEIPVPSQPKLHKQWCLFDQADNIDFDTEVRKIENNEKLLKEDKEKIQILEESIFSGSNPSDLQFPAKRELGAVLYEDILKLQTSGFTDLEDLNKDPKKRHAEHARVPKQGKKKLSKTNKIVRISKHVSSQ